MDNNLNEKNLTNEVNNHPNDGKQDLKNINKLVNPNISLKKTTSEKDSQEKNDKSLTSLKLKITEHYEIDSKENIPEKEKMEKENQFEKDKNNFINDFYSEESERNSPKIIEGKVAIDINEIIGADTKQPITLEMIDEPSITLYPGKISAKSFGLISSYAANTNQGIVRDYNEDRVSVIINMNKPKYYNSSSPWPKLSYFGVFDGHAGYKCAEFLRDNLLNYICNNNFFPNDIPKAIKFGFKKIDEDYLTKYAYINNELIDNSGSCGLILLLINNLIYIANVGDSRCLGSFKNGKIQKDITLDHKPNTPYEKERIIKNGGKVYQTQTPIDDDENYKDKILVGPYRVFPGKLSVSRTVGDAEGKVEDLGGNPNVIVPVPDIFIFDFEKDDIDFFILGCDGIFDQLYSKEIFKCAWMILNNNLDLYKKKIFENKIENNFKGNYGETINMNTTSGNIVDLILKASMIRKSLDNVTCLFISFKDFFDNLENTILNKNKLDEKIDKNDNNKNINGELLLRNKSNLQNEKINKIKNKIMIKEKNKSQNTLTEDNKIIYNNLLENKELKKEKEEDELSKINKNNCNNKKVKGIYSANKNKIRINSLPKQSSLSLNKHRNTEYNIEYNLSNFTNNHNTDKNMTVNNIITYNNNIYVNSVNKKDNKNRANSYNERLKNNFLSKSPNLNFIHSPNTKNNKNYNNYLTNTSNQNFFTKMKITGINFKNKNKNEFKNNYKNNNNINNEDKYRRTTTSFNKKIFSLFIDNTNDMGGVIGNISNNEKYILRSPNNNINKKINYKKLNEIEYTNNFGNNGNNNINNNIRTSSHKKYDYNKLNIKPIVLKTDKGNNNINYYQTNHNIKFNNIIKKNNYGITHNKINDIKNMIENKNFYNLKNITLTKFKKGKKNDEIKIKKPMPTLGFLNVDKKNKFLEENNFVKQKRFITNDNEKRKGNLSENKKLANGNYKIELNFSNRNTSGIRNKINSYYNKNRDINNII